MADTIFKKGDIVLLSGKTYTINYFAVGFANFDNETEAVAAVRKDYDAKNPEEVVIIHFVGGNSQYLDLIKKEQESIS